MHILVEVTKDDIQQGCKTNIFNCPIARALKRTFNQQNVAVGNGEYRLEDCKYKTLSRSAQRFIKRFDNGKKVKPFRFFVEI